MSIMLTWDLKREPVSPPQLYEDTWIPDDSLTVKGLTALELQSTIIKDESLETKSKAEVASRLLEDLEEFDGLYFEHEESFSNWFEEKLDLPIIEDVAVEPVKSYNVPQLRLKHEEFKPIPQFLVTPQGQHQQQNEFQAPHAVPDATNTLLQEFETVFGAVEMTHGQLTPPQSPPLTERQILTTLSPVNTMPVTYIQSVVPAPTVVYYQAVPERPSLLPLELQPGTPQPDVARELAVVDELLRSRAEDMVDSCENSSMSKLTEPASPSSSSISCSSEYSSDPEWIPEPVQTSTLVDRITKSSRRRAGKPYSRIDPEDKKSRKKEQNKNAATRYRMKKKAEIEEILTEEKSLTDSNDELQTKVTDLQREIKYLKGLMRELFKAKGLIQ